MNNDQIFFDGVEQREGKLSGYFSTEVVMATLASRGKIEDLLNRRFKLK